MNENRDEKDTQLLISEPDAVVTQTEETKASFPDQTGVEAESHRFPASSKQDINLPPSNPLGGAVEADDEEIPIQEESEGTQVKELLLSSSDDVILSPSLAPERDVELEKEKAIHKCLKSTIKGFFASYCEVSTVACILRERWVLLLSVLICSKTALETKNTEILAPRLFLVSYCCLVYHMIENMLQYRFLRTTTNIRNEKVECLFDFADKALLTLFMLILNLHYYRLINEWLTVLPPLLFLMELVMYRKHCLISQSQNDMKIVARIFYVLQSLVIAAKMTDIMDSQWKGTLIFLWIYLSIHSLYALFAGLLLAAVCLTSILNLDGRALHFLKTRILGYIWLIGYHMVDVAGLIVLLGLFDKIDSNENDMLEFGLTTAENLSSFLVTFAALLFPVLKKANSNLFQDLGTTLQSQVARAASQKKYAIIKTEDQNKLAYFLRISSTYFSQLRDISQSQFEEMMMVQKNDIENPQSKEEGRLCYICENHVSNAILVECGHGGVCCECALKLVEQKNECMECRKPATAIYKIENEPTNKLEAVVQAHALVEILEV